MQTIELLAEVQALREKLGESYDIERVTREAYISHFNKWQDEKNKRIAATHMAALWKRLAKKYRKDRQDDSMAMDAAYWEIDAGLQVKAALSALKKDARIVALRYRQSSEDTVNGDCGCIACGIIKRAQEASERILEATKEWE